MESFPQSRSSSSCSPYSLVLSIQTPFSIFQSLSTSFFTSSPLLPFRPLFLFPPPHPTFLSFSFNPRHINQLPSAPYRTATQLVSPGRRGLDTFLFLLALFFLLPYLFLLPPFSSFKSLRTWCGVGFLSLNPSIVPSTRRFFRVRLLRSPFPYPSLSTSSSPPPPPKNGLSHLPHFNSIALCSPLLPGRRFVRFQRPFRLGSIEEKGEQPSFLDE